MAETIEDIERRLANGGAPSSDFDLNPNIVLPADRKLRQAAVLVGLIERDYGLNVILTKRSSHLKHHPGQIAFPGGKAEELDKDLIDTALREANEEIGLPMENANILGQLAPHETVTSFQVTPIVAHITQEFSPSLELEEVAEFFEVPLKFVTNVENFQVQHRIWQGQKRQYFTVPYGPYYIWGATARILRGFADRMTD